MKVIVVGCGRVGAQLANRLYQKGMQVTVIDESKAAFDNLDPNFRGRTLEGDVLAQDMLRRAGIEHADSLAAVTSSDTLNVSVAHIAINVYHVPYVVARNYEPRYQSLYESFGVNALSMSNWGAQRMEELLAGVALKTVFSAGNGEVEIYELVIPESWAGRRLGDLINGCGCAGRGHPRRQGHAARSRYRATARRCRARQRHLRRDRRHSPADCRSEGELTWLRRSSSSPAADELALTWRNCSSTRAAGCA
jgi:trk system potassium uptake protein TrkA